MRYRADIDGLRAISVLSVVFFHAGLTRGFAGGFVGVDVFFVISGYLIANQIYFQLPSASPSAVPFLVWFYERRARRILPAFYFISALTGIAGYVLYLPDQFEAFAKSLLSSLVFSANIYFWLTAGYFDAEAHSKPLLHYWSLGVEEHFYLFFPIAIFFLWRFGQTVIGYVLAGLFVVSLAGSQIALPRMNDAVFYLIQFRAWELLAGSLLALPAIAPPRNNALATLSCVGGLALLTYSIGFTDQNEFPGFAALPPVTGAVMIIWAGGRPNRVSTLLGNPPMRYFGLISYSLYLSHWPVMVFVKHLYPRLGGYEFVLSMIAVSLAVAVFSYHFVERPTRSRNGFWTSTRIAGISLGFGATSAALATAIVWTDGYAARLPNDARSLLAYRYDHRSGYREGTCFLRPEQSFEEIDQDVCLPIGSRVALLWGDSYAAHFVPGLKPRLEAAGYTFAQANASFCAPMLDRIHPARPHCTEFNHSVLEWVEKTRPKIVILSATWPRDKNALGNLNDTLTALGRIDGLTTVVLGQSPMYRDKVASILAERRLRSDLGEFSRSDILPSSFSADQSISAVVARHRGAKFVSITDTACPGRSCRMVERLRPFHFDRGHLTDVGSEFYSAAIFAKILEAADGYGPPAKRPTFTKW